MKDKSLKNQIAIVTGGGVGIGKAIALKLFDKGACVVVNDINQELIDDLKKEAKGNGNIFFSCGDITSEDYRQELINETLNKFNGIAPGRITKEKIDDQRIPLSSQSGTTEDIADIVAFLSNITLSGYITGETITVDGGLSLHFEK